MPDNPHIQCKITHRWQRERTARTCFAADHRIVVAIGNRHLNRRRTDVVHQEPLNESGCRAKWRHGGRPNRDGRACNEATETGGAATGRLRH